MRFEVISPLSLVFSTDAKSAWPPSGVVSLENFYFKSASSLGTVRAGDYLRFQVGRVHDDMLRLSHNLCSARQSTSLSLWHKVTLLVEGAFNSKPRDAHVHSLGDYTRIGAAVDDGDEANSLCSFFSYLVLACKAFLFAPRVLRYANATCSISCAMSTEEHALFLAPPQPRQLLGVRFLKATFICRN